MKALVNHPGMELRDDAADSLERFERDHGVQPITSARRTVAEQQSFIDRYDNPKTIYDKPPYLYNPRRPASAGLHVSGVALDTSAPEAFHVDGARYGWRFLYPYDKVHFEYDPAYDTKPSVPTITPVGDIMTSRMITIKTGNTTSVALYNPDTMQCIIGLNDTAVTFHENTGVKWAAPKKDVQATAVLNGYNRQIGRGAN